MRFGLLVILTVSVVHASSSAAQSAGDTQKPRILILHSYHHGFTWSDNISEGIRSVFADQEGRVELRFEFMDTRRIYTEEYFQELAALYVLKYAGQDIDVVICSDDQAFNFMLGPGREIFPEAPVVFLSVSGYDPSLRRGRELTGLLEVLDIQATLDAALSLHPGTEEVAVITDMTRTGRALKTLAEKVFLGFEERARIYYLEDLTIDELKGRVAGLSENTIVFLFIFSRDRAGHVFSREHNLKILAEHCPVPIYSVWEFYLGHGIVGGKLTRGEEEGRLAGRMASRIIQGEKASEITPMLCPNRYMFDYLQLARFGVEESNLPKGSIVINRPFSIYDEYRYLIWGVGSAFVLLLVAVTILAGNIVRRKRAEEELTRLATAIDQAAESVVVTDGEGRILYVNPAFLRVSGFSRREVVGQKPSLVKSGEHDEAFYRNLWETISDGGVWTGRFINKRKDGTVYEEEASISPIRDAGGHITNYVAVKRDVTEEVRLERQLRQAQKLEAVGTLAGGIAHDFNNILAAVIGYTELASMDVPEESVAKINLKKILKSSLRARDLVTQILSFSRQTEQEKVPIQVQPIVKEALKLLRASLPATIEIQQNIDEDAGIIKADVTQIHQVLMNLCTNAAHAMEEAGDLLEVSLTKIELGPGDGAIYPDLRPGIFVRLTVRDTGCGMDRATLDRIFEPYFTTKEPDQGTGMGLAVVHGIVMSHGGAIRVKSAPGEGTSFDVLFPRVESEAAHEGEDMEALPKGSERILFVDDEEALTDLGRQILERLGYEVECFTNSPEALERFKEKPDHFDLLVTDTTMPQMTGEVLVQKVRQIRPDIPVILCTGYSERVDEERARELGIDEFAMKPMEADHLAKAVRRVLDR